MIGNSTADFADLHAYPIVGELTLAQMVQNYGFVGYQQQKPVLMGEFSASLANYAAITDAATALKNWQIQSCSFSFQGWLLWTWDLGPSEAVPGDADWTAMSGEGSVNSVGASPALQSLSMTTLTTQERTLCSLGLYTGVTSPTQTIRP